MLYLYMYLTRNHQDFRGKFLFPFLVLPEKGEKLRKKNCLRLVVGGLSTSIPWDLAGAPRPRLGESCNTLTVFHYAELS